MIRLDREFQWPFSFSSDLPSPHILKEREFRNGNLWGKTRTSREVGQFKYSWYKYVKIILKNKKIIENKKN
jgi:hypothetical protein